MSGQQTSRGIAEDSGFANATTQTESEYFDADEWPEVYDRQRSYSFDEAPEQTNYRGRSYSDPGYYEPELRTDDSRRFILGQPMSMWGRLRKKLAGLKAPYGTDPEGNPLHGPAPYEEYDTTWKNIDLNRSWTMEKPILEDMGFHFVGLIGTGGFAEVYEVTKDNRTMACKVLQIKRFQNKKDLKTGFTKMTNEINVLRGVTHRHILSIDTVVYRSDQKTSFPSLFAFVFMERMEGSLTLLIHSWKMFKESEARLWFTQISDALDYLHHKNISHLDIKPDNILYQRIGGQFIFKLSDFGIAMAFGEDEPSLTTERHGTPFFKAPELCEKQPFLSVSTLWPQKYDTKICDIYSLGITLAFSLIGSLDQLRQGTTAIDWIHNNLVKEQGFDVRHAVIDLLTQMTQKDPIRRYAIDNVVAHHWLQEGEQQQE